MISFPRVVSIICAHYNAPAMSMHPWNKSVKWKYGIEKPYYASTAASKLSSILVSTSITFGVESWVRVQVLAILSTDIPNRIQFKGNGFLCPHYWKMVKGKKFYPCPYVRFSVCVLAVTSVILENFIRHVGTSYRDDVLRTKKTTIAASNFK